MTDLNQISNYPKSSCTCYRCDSCDKDKFEFPNGTPTNMSIRACQYSPYYDCHSTRAFKVQEEPTKKHGVYFLNPAIIENDKFAKNFKSINVKSCPRTACNGTTYLNSDARLYNAAGPSFLQLDRPPYDSSVKLSTLPEDKSLDYYGQNYKSYSDINAGHILYYISRDREDAFYEPLFSSDSTTIGVMYKDPMGSMKPQYDRIPKDDYNPIRDNPCDVSGKFNLSWMKDSQFHREDLISKQMRKRNEQRFAPRWTNVNGNH